MDDARAEILDLLRENARYTTADLARLSGLDEERVDEVIADLEADGTIVGYRAVVDPTELDPEVVEALIELNVTLDRETGYDDIAERLAQFPEVESLRLVSGDYDFALEVESDSMGALSRFVSEQVAPVPEVTQTVTHFIMTSYKEGGIEFGDGDDDDRLSVTP